MNFEHAGYTARSIWVVVGILIGIIIFYNSGGSFDWPHMATVAVMVLSAFLSTVVVFGMTMSAIEKTGMSAGSSTTKSKKESRNLNEMLARLDDEDLDRLRDLLDAQQSYGLDDDGELVQRPRK